MAAKRGTGPRSRSSTGLDRYRIRRRGSRIRGPRRQANGGEPEPQAGRSMRRPEAKPDPGPECVFCSCRPLRQGHSPRCRTRPEPLGRGATGQTLHDVATRAADGLGDPDAAATRLGRARRPALSIGSTPRRPRLAASWVASRAPTTAGASGAPAAVPAGLGAVALSHDSCRAPPTRPIPLSRVGGTRSNRTPVRGVADRHIGPLRAPS